jgi:hypothetical protein
MNPTKKDPEEVKSLGGHQTNHGLGYLTIMVASIHEYDSPEDRILSKSTSKT